MPKGCIRHGDNRNGSTDSRYAELGMVDTGYVQAGPCAWLSPSAISSPCCEVGL